MDITPKSARVPSDYNSANRLLHRIAASLAVPVETLVAPRNPHVLHNAVDGSRWLLVRSSHGKPAVRHVGVGGDAGADEGISAFIAENTGSPQYEALVDLVEHLLVAHLND